MLFPGVVLSGRYRLNERVATGGMGEVWRGTDIVLGREVAVKVLLPALVSDPDFIARFRAEARMMAALRHPGIVQVFDCGEDALAEGGRADYLVMEFVDGEPLSRRIEAAGHLGVAETMAIVAQAAQALHAAHAGGIVHRDVKPSNLLVQPDGTVVLVDFGVARSASITSITSVNAVPGTALYMAPEQAAGRPVSAATDIYALGAVAYCCLTGAPPFTGDNPLQVAVRHLDDEPAPLPPQIPAPVAELVARALAKDPADRFASAAVFADAARSVQYAVPGEPMTAGAATVAAAGLGSGTVTDQPLVTSGRARSRRATVAGAAAAILVALAGLAAAVGFQSEVNPPATNVPQQAPAPSVTPQAQATEGATTDPSRPSRPNAPRTGSSTSTGATPTAVPPTGAPEPSATATAGPEPTAEPTDPPASNTPTELPPPTPTTEPVGETAG